MSYNFSFLEEIATLGILSLVCYPRSEYLGMISRSLRDHK
jgi:hypothetical protein